MLDIEQRVCAVLRQQDPDCFIVKQMYQSPFVQKLVGRTTVEAAGVRDPLYFRPGTTDIEVIREVFKKQVFSMTRLRQWPEIRAFLEGEWPVINV
jgi:hypothetical protein